MPKSSLVYTIERPFTVVASNKEVNLNDSQLLCPCEYKVPSNDLSCLKILRLFVLARKSPGTRDGMPLSASTDLDMHFELKESKRLAKSLARKANQYPTRCAMQCGNHMIYFVKAVGVCFLAVCNGTYPAVLVFCFLEELQREFVITFQSQDVQRAKRPYSFIEFDSFIQKTKQRYNNTRTLTSRLNLSEMSEDLHNNPPFQISQSELGPENNTDVKTYKTGGPTRRLEPLTWKSLTACVLAGICGLLNFLRCFPFLNVIVLDDEVRE